MRLIDLKQERLNRTQACLEAARTASTNATAVAVILKDDDGDLEVLRVNMTSSDIIEALIRFSRVAI